MLRSCNGSSLPSLQRVLKTSYFGRGATLIQTAAGNLFSRAGMRSLNPERSVS